MASPLTPKSKADIASSILRSMIETQKPMGLKTFGDYTKGAIEAADTIIEHYEKPKIKKEPIA